MPHAQRRLPLPAPSPMVAAFALLTAAALACGPTSTGGDSLGAEDGGTSGATDADTASRPDSRGATEFVDAGPDAGCGLQQENIDLVSVPPDMLIVLDRSGSMTNPINLLNPFGGTRWSVMRDALKRIVMTTENEIRWGLSVFPTDNDCGVSAGTEVGIDLGRYAAIAGWLDGHDADGNTPAHLGLREALATYQNLTPSGDGRYVLFATDGVPSCADSSSEANAQTLAAITALAAAGIKTYVIGFGDPLGLDTQLLNDAAQAGGTARPSTPYYYEATDASQLSLALEQISVGVAVPSCSYQLGEQPPDPDLVTVTVDDVAVPRSTNHTNGWDYHPDASTITFFGSYCDQIEAGTVSSVEFFFGCPGPVID